MFVHHSRNTAAKQWSETRSLAIESVSRIVKEHGIRWNDLELEIVKDAVMQIVEFIRQSTQTHTSEIAKTTVRHYQEMLEADALRDEIKEILWKGAWEIWFGLAESASSGVNFFTTFANHSLGEIC
jgi:histone H3/H4